MKKSNKLKQLSNEESNHLNGIILRLKSKSNDFSAATISESHLSSLSKGISMNDYKWLRQDVNLIFASAEKYGDIGTTSAEIHLNGALAPSNKKRYAYLHMFSGVTAKGGRSFEGGSEDYDGQFIWDAIFGLVEKFLPLLGILKDVLGTIIKGWNDFVKQLPNNNPKSENQNMSDAWQSESDLAKKIHEVPPKKLAKPGKGNFPKFPDSSIKSMDLGKESLRASQSESAGAYIYFHSSADNSYYGPVSYDFASTSQLKYPDSSSIPMELPSMCDRIAILWKNDPRNDTENGGVWGKISFLEEK